MLTLPLEGVLTCANTSETKLFAKGAFVALILNNAMMDVNIFSFTFLFYYFPHALECRIPLIMLKLKLIKLDKKYLLSTLLILSMFNGIKTNIVNATESIPADQVDVGKATTLEEKVDTVIR